MHFEIFETAQKENQRESMDRSMTEKCISHTMKRNLLFLKDLLGICIKNVYYDVLDDVMNEWNDTYYRTIIIKPIDVRSNSFAECNADS